MPHIIDKNKLNIDFLFYLVQCFKTFLFGSIFQDFLSLTHTQNYLHFKSSFSLLALLPFYIYLHTTFHVIPYQIHTDQK